MQLPPKYPRLLSSVYGRIDELLIVLPGKYHSRSERPLKAIKEHFEALGRTVVQLVVKGAGPRNAEKVHSEVAFDDPRIQELIRRGRATPLEAKLDIDRMIQDGRELKELPSVLTHTSWSQDPFCVLKLDGEYNILLQPLYGRKFIDRFISYELSLELNRRLLLRPTLHLLEGGNIIGGGDFALIGKNTLVENVIEWMNQDPVTFENDATAQERVEKKKQGLAEVLGLKEIIWLGLPGAMPCLVNKGKLTYQPLFHIDLFVTLGGKAANGMGLTEELVFVADPKMSLDMLRRLGLQDSNDRNSMGLQFSDDRAYSYFREIQRYFIQYNQEEEKRKFKVVPLPIYIEESVVYSYNNCHVEIDQGIKRAFLPNYVDQEKLKISDPDNRNWKRNLKLFLLQKEVELILRANGFDEVYFLGDGVVFQEFARLNGSLHCLTKVIRRSN